MPPGLSLLAESIRRTRQAVDGFWLDGAADPEEVDAKLETTLYCIVPLGLFAGFMEDQIPETVEVRPRTVRRGRGKLRVWLYREVLR